MNKIKSGYYKGLSKKQAQAYKNRRESTARYKEYVKQYNTKQDKLAMKHQVMYDTKLSKKQFEQVYKRYKEEYRQGNITQKIVRDQTYELSDKQMRAYHEAAWNIGSPLTYEELRQYGPDAMKDVFSKIQQTREYLKAKGANNAYIDQFIRTEYFGSPD